MLNLLNFFKNKRTWAFFFIFTYIFSTAFQAPNGSPFATGPSGAKDFGGGISIPVLEVLLLDFLDFLYSVESDEGKECGPAVFFSSNFCSIGRINKSLIYYINWPLGVAFLQNFVTVSYNQNWWKAIWWSKIGLFITLKLLQHTF